LTAELPGLMDMASRDARERDSGQTSLFDEEAVPDGGRAETPPVPEWTQNVKLGFEKEVLGFYVTGHPLAEHERELRCLCSASLSGLKELKDGQACVVGGIILGIKHSLTKRHETMARVTLEDLEGVAEALVWPSTYAKAQGKLNKEALILVRGKVDLSGEAPKVSAEEIMTLDEAVERLPKRVHFNIGGLDEQGLEKLRGLLQRHPGTVEVYIHKRENNRDVIQRLGAKFRIKLGRDVNRELKAVLGEDFWMECGNATP
jgi:DNA polymerase-3 subunit alpha